MNGPTLYTIGQVAKICDISIQTLRFYHKEDVVVPTAVDPENGYRLYSNRDVLCIKIVQDLRRMNFSLEEISEVLRHNDLDAVLLLMRQKREDAALQIRQLETMVTTMDQRIQNMEVQRLLYREADQLAWLVELKHLPDRQVAFDRQRSACGMEPYTMRFTELMKTVLQNGLVQEGYLMTVYHEDLLAFQRNDSDIEVCVPVSGGDSSQPGLRVIKGGLYVSTCYFGIGTEDTCKQAYRKLLEWMEQHHYTACGPPIEVYRMDFTKMMNPDEFIIELQIPVQRTLTL